jgi:translation initiation factor 2 beta subunit (eIF-2beta)/eIF-5
MGHIGTLPELYQEITVKYSRIKGRNDDLPKFTVGEQVTIVVNSSSMPGVVTSIEHKHIVNIKLVSLVCTVLDVPTAVFRKINHKYKLCYFGKIVDGTQFENIINQPNYELYSNVNEPIEIIDDLKEVKIRSATFHKEMRGISEVLVPEFNDYHQMLKVKETMKVYVEPFRIINPDIQYSNKKYFWSNYFDVLNCVAKVKESDTSDSIDQLKHLRDYISEKVSCVTSLNADNQLVIRGKINSKEIKNIINAYSGVYKTCPQCKTVDTYLVRVERMLKLKCRNCTCMHTVA